MKGSGEVRVSSCMEDEVNNLARLEENKMAHCAKISYPTYLLEHFVLPMNSIPFTTGV